MKTSKLLEYVAPGTEWALIDEPQNATEYKEALTWLSEGAAPTWAALQAAKPQAEYEKAHTECQEARFKAYQTESDPLFFQWQRGEATEEAWKAKVAEIQARYPEPVKP